MKKNNFTDQEIATIVKELSPKLNARVNKGGNITVVEVASDGRVFWVLYYVGENRYLWRKHTWNGYGTYCHPLNMVGRKRIGEIHRETYGTHTFTWYDREWDIRKCEFDSVENAVKYFKNYLKKYRHINVK